MRIFTSSFQFAQSLRGMIVLRGSLLVIILCVVLFSFLTGCLTSPIIEVREQSYAQVESVLLLSVSEIEENLVTYHAKCKNGHWLKPSRGEDDVREMVFGNHVNAREFRVDGWIEFHPMGGGRTHMIAFSSPRGRAMVNRFMSVVQNPLVCY